MPNSLNDMTDLQLVVRPGGARKMLNCGNERLYQLLNSRELDSFRDGRARLITVASIHRYIARRLAEAGGPPTSLPAASPPRRGRPRRRHGGADRIDDESN
jgi:hypothetical protein